MVSSIRSSARSVERAPNSDVMLTVFLYRAIVMTRWSSRLPSRSEKIPLVFVDVPIGCRYTYGGRANARVVGRNDVRAVHLPLGKRA